MNRRLLLLVPVCAVLVLLGWWWSSPSTVATPTTGAVTRAETPATRSPSRAAPRAAPADGPGPTGDEANGAEKADALEGAIGVAFPTLGRIRCVTTAMPPEADPEGPAPIFPIIDVHQGALVAVVTQVQGEAIIRSANSPDRVHLTWSGATPGQWGTCIAKKPETVEVHGVLRWPDGEPAAEEQLTGCPGDILLSDTEGRFTLSATVGQPCWPTGFIEDDDGSFGRGKPVEVHPKAPGPQPDIEVFLPTDARMMSRQQQLALLPKLVSMLQTTAEGLPDPAGAAIPGAPDPSSAALLRQWSERVQARRQRMLDDVEPFLDPEADDAELRDAFLFGIGP